MRGTINFPLWYINTKKNPDFNIAVRMKGIKENLDESNINKEKLFILFSKWLL